MLPKITKNEYIICMSTINHPLLICECPTCLKYGDDIAESIHVNLYLINNVHYIPYNSCIELHDKILDRHGNKFIFDNDTDILYFVAHAVSEYQTDEKIMVEKFIVEKQDDSIEILWKCIF